MRRDEYGNKWVIASIDPPEHYKNSDIAIAWLNVCTGQSFISELSSCDVRWMSTFWRMEVFNMYRELVSIREIMGIEDVLY
jgi:hypothetical protein